MLNKVYMKFRLISFIRLFFLNSWVEFRDFEQLFQVLLQPFYEILDTSLTHIFLPFMKFPFSSPKEEISGYDCPPQLVFKTHQFFFFLLLAFTGFFHNTQSFRSAVRTLFTSLIKAIKNFNPVYHLFKNIPSISTEFFFLQIYIFK